MRDIEKLLRKLSKKERQVLLAVIEALLKKEHGGLSIKKLQGSDLCRVRKGNFRIIFHYDSKGAVVVDSIRLRREDTYRDV